MSGAIGAIAAKNAGSYAARLKDTIPSVLSAHPPKRPAGACKAEEGPRRARSRRGVGVSRAAEPDLFAQRFVEILMCGSAGNREPRSEHGSIHSFLWDEAVVRNNELDMHVPAAL